MHIGFSSINLLFFGLGLILYFSKYFGVRLAPLLSKYPPIPSPSNQKVCRHYNQEYSGTYYSRKGCVDSMQKMRPKSSFPRQSRRISKIHSERVLTLIFHGLSTQNTDTYKTVISSVKIFDFYESTYVSILGERSQVVEMELYTPSCRALNSLSNETTDVQAIISLDTQLARLNTKRRDQLLVTRNCILIPRGCAKRIMLNIRILYGQNVNFERML